MKIRSYLAGLLAAAFLCVGSAHAQTSPNLTYGQVPTPAQWNSYFASKQDVLGYTPLNSAGGVMLGRLVTAPPSGTTAGLNLTPGTAPGSPVNGDLWVTSAGLFVRVNGSTVGPLASSASVSLAVGSTPISGGVSGRVLYQNGSVLGEMTTSGSGTVLALTNGPTIASPTFSGTVAGAGTIPNAVLVNSSVTIGSTSVALGATQATISGLTLASPVFSGTVSGAGTIPNSVLVNASTTVNGQICALGGVCTISASAGTITVGTTAIASGNIGRILYEAAGNLLGEYLISGSGTTVAMNTAPAITGGSHVALTALGIRSTGAAFDLTLASTEAFTAGRTLTITLNDAARALTMGGNIVTAANFTTAGAFSLTLTTTAATNVTLPLTGTLATLAGTEALTGKTYNGLTITTTTGTLTIASGKTLTVNNSIALSGTDATVMTLPTTSATIARTDAGQTFTGTQAFSGAVTHTNTVTITSASASALAVGLNGATNPVLQVNASTGSQAAGLSITGGATGGGVALATIDSGSNSPLSLNAKGSGTIAIGSVSTGGVTITPALTLGSTINGLTITTSAAGVLTIAPGKTHVVSNGITLVGTDSTTWTGASSNMTLAALNLSGQVITGGATVTPQSLSTGSITVDCGTRPFQTITGAQTAWSITAPAADGQCIIKLTNAATSAVIPTFSGFSVGSNTGAALTSVGSSIFMIQIGRIGGTSFYSIYANQ